MNYDFLTEDLYTSQKAIGTDQGLAKIGDGIVNLTYSVAKSIHLSKTSSTGRTIRTGTKVSKKILGAALKRAGMKNFTKNRGDAHDFADTVEAIVAYVYLKGNMSIEEIIDFLVKELTGDLYKRLVERESAIVAFTNLLNYMKQFLPNK